MPRPTSTLVLLLALLCIFVSVERSSGLSCRPCENRKHCLNEPTYCRWGFTKGVCGCCIVCSKGPGEKCGGTWHQDGRCATGLTCLITKRTFPRGICVKVPSHPDSSEEDNSFSIESREG
ncbi:venom protein 302-like [Oratosquilla oratoria]|uniref:venom protein 302-like n=1 Tax=Oratosquilla oratoria TaxID=337810 RepID=UPI003F76269A